MGAGAPTAASTGKKAGGMFALGASGLGARAGVCGGAVCAAQAEESAATRSVKRENFRFIVPPF
jgi:hypothetical protein